MNSTKRTGKAIEKLDKSRAKVEQLENELREALDEANAYLDSQTFGRPKVARTTEEWDILLSAMELSFMEASVKLAQKCGTGIPALEADTILGMDETGIWSYAHKLGWAYDVTPEDGFQELVLQAFEILAEEPGLIGKRGAYLLHSAYLKARNSMKANNRLTTLYVDDGYDRIEYGAELSYIDAPDDRIDINEVILQFDEVGRTICNCLAQGYGKRDAGKVAGISAPAVSQRLKTMRKAFDKVGLTPKAQVKVKVVEPEVNTLLEHKAQGYSYKLEDVQTY